MAKVEKGVRSAPVKAEAEDLAFARNEEDAPVLERVRTEVNLLGGDTVVLQDQDYVALPSDYAILAFSSTQPMTITLPDPTTEGLLGKHYIIRRAGPFDVIIDAGGIFTYTLSTGTSPVGRDALFILVDVGDILDPPRRYYLFSRQF